MITDVRVYPLPGDLKIISEPGVYTGWMLAIEIDKHTYSIPISKLDTKEIVSDKLLCLAGAVK